MTKKLFTLKQMALTMVVVMLLGMANCFTTAAHASALTQLNTSNNYPHTIAFIEADSAYIDLDNAMPEEIANRFVRNSIENGYIYIFRTTGNRNLDLALEKLDKQFNLKDKTIKDPTDLDQAMLTEAANYLGSEQFSVVRIQIKEKSKETTEQKVGKILGYAAAAATIISIFKK